MAREFNKIEMAIIRDAAGPYTKYQTINMIAKRNSYRKYTVWPFDVIALGSLGGLDKLPPEIRPHIVTEMDLLTAMRFRRVSKRAQQLVNRERLYKTIATDATDFLHVLLATRVASRYTIRKVYNLLHDDMCEAGDCRRIGVLLDLAGGYRSCLNCFEFENPYQDRGVRSLDAVCDIMQVDKAWFKQHYGIAISTFRGLNYQEGWTNEREVELVPTRTLSDMMVKEKTAKWKKGGPMTIFSAYPPLYKWHLQKKFIKAPWSPVWRYMTVMYIPYLGKPHTVDSDYVYSCQYCFLDMATAEHLFRHALECGCGRDGYEDVVLTDYGIYEFPKTEEELKEVQLQVFGRILRPGEGW